MTTETFPKLIKAEPFKSFVIRTADGRELTVNHPENIAYGGGGRIAVVVNGDDVEIIDLLLVPSLKVAH